MRFYAYNVRHNYFLACTRTAWLIIPSSECEALRLGRTSAVGKSNRKT